ncbi:P49 [Choristoneura occidentalis granulovirus]|uniref:p49 n=2 Tax=Betabaculovirus chofumiferanae TaxID=3051997 RepID=Q918V9_GVCF|nr:P49 [Choristoneura fumiferana granulovirus]AAL05837.1 p49 [Choristoneura fumiferana granulovirus]ABC61147.1 P49 [Choristoneura fumiferana granulovirus]ABD36808.1 p49 [Choristoneura fumiferana granulovirus]
MDFNSSDENLPLAFMHLYFELDKRHTEIDNYISDSKNYARILDYLNEINLKFIIGDASVDTFIYIMPQFKFVCDKDYQLEIVKFSFGNAYLRKGALVFATNFFVTNPSDAFDFIIPKIPLLRETFETQTRIGTKFYIWNGTDGIIFSRTYLDWMGMKVCNGKPYYTNNYYRMYVVGERLAKQIIEEKISIENTPFDAVLKNYYKGTFLRFTDNEKYVLADKKINTNNYDVVFDMFEEEFKSNVAQIHFIQRDYIFDGKFPLDLLNELQSYWTSDTSVYKVINKFGPKNQIQDLIKTIVIDRYSVNGYRKMIVDNIHFVLPANRSSDVEHVFIPRNVIQIRHTLNAAFVPNLGLVIMASNVFFGARIVLNFEPHVDLNYFVKTKINVKDTDIFYHVGGSYFLEETFFNTNNVQIYILVRIDEDLIVRHNLIRTSHKLTDLKYYWVLNTILSLFVRK